MNQHKLALRISLSALMAALGTVFMLASSLIPVLTYASPMLASVMLLPVLCEFGRKYAWMTWAVTAMLALMLCTDREAAFFYLFLGYYPIIKPLLDRIPSRAGKLLVKMLFFTIVLFLVFLLLAFVLCLEDMKSEMLLSIAVYFLMIGTMMLFDRAYEKMQILYAKQFRTKLFK